MGKIVLMKKSNDIEVWLREHPAISYNWLGVRLGLAVGQLREDRSIPKKYRLGAERVLMDYGYVPGLDSVNEMVTGSEEPYFVKTKMGVRMTRVGYVPESVKQYPETPEECFAKTHEVRNGVIGVLEGNLFKRVLLDEGDYYIKKL
jgi:hypothetical protein